MGRSSCSRETQCIMVDPTNSPHSTTEPAGSVVARLQMILHELLDLVREEILVHGGHLKDTHVISPSQVLKERIAAFLVQRHDHGLGAVEGGLHDVVERLR